MVTASHAPLMIYLLTHQDLYFDGIVAAHALVHTPALCYQSPFGRMVGIYTPNVVANTLGISLGT
ncbi:MAG TPA: hypothetical protein VN638_00460 [Nitrospiraceae bacterium]|nr:hypothetical protein [Nitrospiraceae bacterium]